MGFCRSPDPKMVGALLYGPDPGLIAERRRALALAITGENGQEEMRLASLGAQDARKDPALITDGLRAQSFFPGRRALVIEDATDGLAAPLKEILGDTSAEDAFLILTAGVLPTRSTLRKLAEASENFAAVQIYPDAPDRQEIHEKLKSAGLQTDPEDSAWREMQALASELDHGQFAQIIEKVGVFSLGRDEPLTREMLLELVPASMDVELDQLVFAVAEGKPEIIGPLMQRLEAAGTAPTTVMIAMARHFRQLLRAASAAGGPDAGIAAIRPPLWGPRKTAFTGQLRRWGAERLERANRLLFELDGKLRQSSAGPARAQVERGLLRLAMMAGR